MMKNLLLQIADYGKITDSHGREVSFKNTYIILTSNAVSADSTKEIGFFKSRPMGEIQRSLKDFFSTEFIARMDEIIYFAPLNHESLLKITEKAFLELGKRVKKFDITVKVDDEAVNFVAKKGLLQGGVRNIIAYIKQNIENKIALTITGGECEKDDLILVTLKDRGLETKVKKKSRL